MRGSLDASPPTCSLAAQTRSYEALYLQGVLSARAIHGCCRSRARQSFSSPIESTASVTVVSVPRLLCLQAITSTGLCCPGCIRRRSIGLCEKAHDGNTWTAWVGSPSHVPTANTRMQQVEGVAEGELGRGGRVVVKHGGPVMHGELSQAVITTPRIAEDRPDSAPMLPHCS
jgi:hypothetical protein